MVNFSLTNILYELSSVRHKPEILESGLCRGLRIWDLVSGSLLASVCDSLVFRCTGVQYSTVYSVQVCDSLVFHSLDTGPGGLLAAATSPSSQHLPSAIYLVDTRRMRTNNTCPGPRVRRLAGSEEPSLLDPVSLISVSGV